MLATAGTRCHDTDTDSLPRRRAGRGRIDRSSDRPILPVQRGYYLLPLPLPSPLTASLMPWPVSVPESGLLPSC